MKFEKENIEYKSMSAKTKTIVYLSLLAFIFPKPVHAYIDPSTGSYLFQFLVASLFGGAFYFRSTLKKIKDYASKKLQGK